MSYPLIVPRSDIYEAIADERARQDRMKAEGRFRFTCADPEMTLTECLAVLVEEVGEVARAMLEQAKLANDVHGAEIRKELVQVAAVCVAAIEGLDARAFQKSS